MTCAICGIRKPKRFCPGVGGDICTICCGTGREETVNCPLSCGYLREAHQHERLIEVSPETLPNADIEVSDSFLESHEWLVVLLGSAAHNAAKQHPGITDYDIRESFEPLVRSYRARQSGLILQTPPVNPLAASVFDAVQARVDHFRKREAETTGSSILKDTDILLTLVFLQKLEYLHNNGRKRSRAFLDLLSQFFEVPEEESSAIDLEPDEPRIIL